jgi:hypothetical protein
MLSPYVWALGLPVNYHLKDYVVVESEQSLTLGFYKKFWYHHALPTQYYCASM